MNERDALFLSHVLAAIDDIAVFTAEGRAAFIADKKTQSAVIRQLEVIGEAVKRLSPETIAAGPSVPWRAIAGTRDRLIHGYFGWTCRPYGRWSSRTSHRCATRWIVC